jgi:hypothetical protein
MNINIFNDLRTIINYFNIIFENKFYNSEKKILYLFLHENLEIIYNILYKNKKFIKKHGLDINDEFFNKFTNILYKNKTGGGIQLLVNNSSKNLLNTFKISSKLNKNEIISNFFNKIYILNPVNLHKDLFKNPTDLDKQLEIYIKRLIRKTNTNNIKINEFFNNNFSIYLSSYKNERNIIDIDRLIHNLTLLTKKCDNSLLSVYLKFLSEIFKTNIIEKDNKIIFLIIIIFGLNTCVEKINNIKFNKDFDFDTFIIIFMILCFLLEIIEKNL